MSKPEKSHGDQFDADRYHTGRKDQQILTHVLNTAFDAHNVAPVEPPHTYDTSASDKPVYQLIDFTGIDYIIDTFDSPVFGINHRTHTPTDTTLRFDIRTKTGTHAPSELSKLRHAETNDIVPKYASRLKQSDDPDTLAEWVRIVELQPLVNAINGGLQPHKRWTDGNAAAWLFEYDLLKDMGIVHTEIFDPQLPETNDTDSDEDTNPDEAEAND